MISNGRRPLIFIALPHRPGGSISFGLWTATQPGMMGQGFDIHSIRPQPCSLLNFNFNMLWAEALNLRLKGIPLTHFCMVHDDVCPEPGKWLQTLIEEQERVGADILSCVIALKDGCGLSSTGILRWQECLLKKFTIEQCLSFGKTFNADAAGYPGECLLVNSGCWICDFTQPWIEKMCFRSYDTIMPPNEDHDDFVAISTGEDWLFSIDAYRLGLKTFATNAITILHDGIFRYPNNVPWGSGEGKDDWGTPWCIQPPPLWQPGEGLADGEKYTDTIKHR